MLQNIGWLLIDQRLLSFTLSKILSLNSMAAYAFFGIIIYERY